MVIKFSCTHRPLHNITFLIKTDFNEDILESRKQIFRLKKSLFDYKSYFHINQLRINYNFK